MFGLFVVAFFVCCCFCVYVFLCCLCVALQGQHKMCFLCRCECSGACLLMRTPACARHFTIARRNTSCMRTAWQCFGGCVGFVVFCVVLLLLFSFILLCVLFVVGLWLRLFVCLACLWLCYLCFCCACVFVCCFAFQQGQRKMRSPLQL